MKKLSRIVLGLASVTMLASCAKSVTPEEAVKIASDNWSIDKAKAAGYTKVHVVNKYSDSSKDEEHDATGVAMNLIIGGDLFMMSLSPFTTSVSGENEYTVKVNPVSLVNTSLISRTASSMPAFWMSMQSANASA